MRYEELSSSYQVLIVVALHLAPPSCTSLDGSCLDAPAWALPCARSLAGCASRTPWSHFAVLSTCPRPRTHALLSAA
eukprot:1183246-Prorocentrum_minimum.AAC.4